MRIGHRVSDNNSDNIGTIICETNDNKKFGVEFDTKQAYDSSTSNDFKSCHNRGKYEFCRYVEKQYLELIIPDIKVGDQVKFNPKLKFISDWGEPGIFAEKVGIVIKKNGISIQLNFKGAGKLTLQAQDLIVMLAAKSKQTNSNSLVDKKYYDAEGKLFKQAVYITSEKVFNIPELVDLIDSSECNSSTYFYFVNKDGVFVLSETKWYNTIYKKQPYFVAHSASEFKEFMAFLNSVTTETINKILPNRPIPNGEGLLEQMESINSEISNIRLVYSDNVKVDKIDDILLTSYNSVLSNTWARVEAKKKADQLKLMKILR